MTDSLLIVTPHNILPLNLFLICVVGHLDWTRILVDYATPLSQP